MATVLRLTSVGRRLSAAMLHVSEGWLLSDELAARLEAEGLLRGCPTWVLTER